MRQGEQGAHLRQRKQVLIFVQPRTVVQIIPEMQAYRRMDVGDSPVGELVSPSGQIEVNRSGSDTVNGIDTTVYDLIAINDDGTRVDGRVWVSAERIVLRAEGTAMESGKQVGGGYELSNLVTGPHDRSIYQIPAGYQEMQFGVGAPPALGTDTPAVPGLPDPNALAEMMRKQGVPEAQIDAMLKQMNEIQQQLGQ